MSEMDFSGIAAQATEYIQSQGTEGSATPESAAPSTPATPTPNEGQPVAQPTTPVAEDLIEIQLADGTVEKLTRQQIRDGYLRQADYTRKTQELAEQRKALDPIGKAYQQLAQERQQIQQLLSNPELLTQFAVQNFGPQYIAAIQQLAQAQMQQGLPQGANPDDIITAQQAAFIAQQNANQMLAQMQQKLQEMEQRFAQKAESLTKEGIESYEDAQQMARHQEKIVSHINSLFEKHPALKAFPEMEDALRYRVYQRGAETEEQALQYFTEEAEKQAKVLEQHFTNQMKQAVVEKSRLETHGTVPPGGVGVQPQPQSYKKKDGGIDWKSLSASAEAYVQANRK